MTTSRQEKTSGEELSLRRASEDELLARARAGSSSCFSELVLRHQAAIFGLVARMVRDRSVAEELTQDAFLKAYRNLNSFRGDSKLSTWLYRIAVNACHDYNASVIARVRREETDVDDSPAGAIASFEPAPDDDAAARDVARAFQAALDALDESYRESFLLRHQEDLGYREIADVLGITVSNAKVRVHRAREMILEALRKAGHDV